MESKLQICSACKERRNVGDENSLILAGRCNNCDGKGIVIVNDEDYKCNSCCAALIKAGTECAYPFNLNREVVRNSNGLVITYDGKFDSFYLFDCTDYTFILCEKCLREMFDKFKIKPIVFDNIDGKEIDYEQDRKSLDERIIRDIIK